MSSNPLSLNVEIYSNIHIIENVLREFLIERLSQIAGPKWYKSRLPPDVLANYSKSIEFSRSVRWTRLIPHHPIYYTDFGDLRKIIERTDNWTQAFASFFGRKEIIVAMLGELETIRNTTSHNRKNSPLDSALVNSAVQQLRTMLGSTKFDTLTSRFTSLLSISDLLSKLRTEGSKAIEVCTCFSRLDASPAWADTHSAWWFDETYLGTELKPVTEYFDALKDYSKLPRSRGSGHRLEAWVKANRLTDLFLASDETLKKTISVYKS